MTTVYGTYTMESDIFLAPLRRGAVDSGDGTFVSLSSAIWEAHALALHRFVLRYRPAISLEIGMGHAISTLAILSALDEIGAGRLISVDPNQSTGWRGVGRRMVDDAGLSSYHHIVEKPDYLALPELLEDDVQVDFAYVDGWHTVDNVILDAFFLDKMSPIGGVIAFNDCGFPAVRKALRFLTSHRHYRQLDVGLPKNYAASNHLKSLARRVMRASHEDRYLMKEDDWVPPWNYYRRF
jgi:predicted O-methyltransferase YrrM